MKMIACYNNKGGVGKSTIVLNVAHSLAKRGKRVLVMDCDGQQNAARFLCDTLPDADHGLERLLLTAPPISPTAIRMTSRYDMIDVIAATPAINDAAAKYAAQPDILRKEQLTLLREWDKPYTAVDYDFCLMDMPPALNCITDALLSVTDGVIVPIELGSFAIQGVTRVTEALNRCGANLVGCIVSRFDRKNSADVELLKQFRAQIGNKLFDTVIPQSKIIKNSISYRMTAEEYMGWLEPAKAFDNLTSELISETEGL